MDRSPTEWMIEPLRRYAQFTGRARRAEYWWFVLFGFIVSFIVIAVDAILGLTAFGLSTIVSLGLLVPQMAVGFRRMHDIDRSGWWLVAPVIAAVPLAVAFGVTVARGAAGGAGTVAAAVLGLALVVYSIVLLVWACQRGTGGPNRFGPDPLTASD